jgi:NTP pyrophosphatase (non-canonical NTP hydrolase)
MQSSALTLKGAQQLVAQFVHRNALEMSLEARMLDVVSELGELSKGILSATHYGTIPFIRGDHVREECGDLLFSFLCVAAIAGIDLEEALHEVVAKYEARILERGSPSSK